MDIDLDNLVLDVDDERTAAKRRETKLAEDETPIEADNDCGDSCKI